MGHGTSNQGLYSRLHSSNQYSDFLMWDDPEKFKSFFRVSDETFDYICSIVGVHIEKNMLPGLKTIIGRLLTITKQVAMALRRLTTGDSYYSVGEIFEVAAYTSVNISKRFVKFLLIAAIPLHLKWPACKELVNVKLEFQGIPQCFGAIDCIHILFYKPFHTNSVDWIDRDHNYSMILQAIVDSKSRFIDIFTRFPSFVYNSCFFLWFNHQLFVNQWWKIGKNYNRYTRCESLWIYYRQCGVFGKLKYTCTTVETTVVPYV